MGRSACCSKVGLRRGPWSAKEDSLLSSYIHQHGEGQWRSLPKKAGLLRCGKSCRLRWMNYLRPGIKRGNISQDEEDLIVRLHRLLGNRWSLIAGRLPGRTDNEIKNYWNTHLLRKLNNANAAAAKPVAATATATATATTAAAARKRKSSDVAAKATASSKSEEIKNKSVISITTKVFSPKPIRVSSSFPRNDSYESLASSDAATAAVAVSASPEMEEEPPLLYHFDDSFADDMWEKVYAEYMQLL